MRIVLLIVLLTGCGSVVTRQNAVHDCPAFYNVQCRKVLDRPDYPVEYVGKRVMEVCNGNPFGCVVNETIVMRQKDWLVLAQERCHNYCGDAHVKEKRIITIPYIKGGK